MAVVTPTDRSESVRNRLVVEFYVGISAFVIGLGQISFFLI